MIDLHFVFFVYILFFCENIKNYIMNIIHARNIYSFYPIFMSYCHHLASVVVVRRKLFQKSSPLKVLDQWKPNLVRIITRVSSSKIVSGDAVHQPTQPLLLKIEHMVKLQVLGNNSKTVNNIKNLIWLKMISTSRSTYPAILK